MRGCGVSREAHEGEYTEQDQEYCVGLAWRPKFTTILVQSCRTWVGVANLCTVISAHVKPPC